MFIAENGNTDSTAWDNWQNAKAAYNEAETDLRYAETEQEKNEAKAALKTAEKELAPAYSAYCEAYQ